MSFVFLDSSCRNYFAYFIGLIVEFFEMLLWLFLSFGGLDFRIELLTRVIVFIIIILLISINKIFVVYSALYCANCYQMQSLQNLAIFLCVLLSKLSYTLSIIWLYLNQNYVWTETKLYFDRVIEQLTESHDHLKLPLS